MLPSSPSLRDKLRLVFGFDDFRSGQREVIEALHSGRDVLAIMPTGGGKSLCYQLPAIEWDRLTLVVSPLIALMRDQVMQLRTLGVAAGSLNSANDPQENRRNAQAVISGEMRILYAAPERLMREGTLAFLAKAKVGLLAIDEAHCVSQWGHNFRPEYLELGKLREHFPGIPILALTATADEATRAEIVDKLFETEPKVFITGFDRPNISLAMAAKAGARKQLSSFLEPRRGECGIVYCGTRRRTEEFADFLCTGGFTALPYHAGLDPKVRDHHQGRFVNEEGVVMVATVAFGMGIDKPDVRFVCHSDLPKSVEAYYQEIGRAGRDGLPASALTLYGMDDIALHRRRIEEENDDDEYKRVEHQRLTALVALCEAPYCRRQTLLAYFGEGLTQRCGNCDLCLSEVETVDGTIEAQKAMSAMVRTGERFGAHYIVGILRGDETENVKRFGHQRLPTFGVGRDRPRREWQAVLRQLYAAGHIDVDIANYGRITLTGSGRRLLKGEIPFRFRGDVMAPKPGRKSSVPAAAPADLDADDQELLAALKQHRLTLARQQGMPAYIVFPDRTLVEMARLRPALIGAMATVHGVGAAKLDRYGDSFLEIIRANVSSKSSETGTDPAARE